MFIVAMGCAAPAAPFSQPPVAPASPQPAPQEPARMKSSLTPAQRETLGPRLLAYGSGWDLSNLEQFMDVRVAKTAKGHQLTLTMRGPSGLRSVKQLDDDSLSGENLQIPPGDELTAAQLANV
jgi:hypothetical protein